jgi:hypothetical protein
MNENSLCNKLTLSQLEGSRKKERPKFKWVDDVSHDLKTLKVTVYWKKAQDRDKVEGCYQGGQGSQRAIEPE